MLNFEEITSRDNGTVKSIIKLQSSVKERKNKGLFVIEGVRILEDALENNVEFNTFVFNDTAYEKYTEIIEKFAGNAQKTLKIPDYLFEKISDTSSPQGVLAVCKIENENKKTIDKCGKYIAFENVQDPSNLGAAARTGEALGISGIILSNNGCDPYSPKCLRASMGALLRIPVIVLKDFKKEITGLGLKTYAFVLNNCDFSLGEKQIDKGSIAIIGNEANGLSEELTKNSDYRVNIPMKGSVESLNASVAASIVMWEMLK